jgi:hypothetical protein
MSVRVVEFSEAPRPMRGLSGPRIMPEYAEVMAAIRDPKNATKAIVVTIDTASLENVGDTIKKRPEVGFAYALRRYFTETKSNWTAYQSGKMEITVRRMTKAEAERKAAKAK